MELPISQLKMAALKSQLHQWMSTRADGAEGLETLVCDGKTLRGSSTKTDSGAATLIAQISPYSRILGVEIAQSSYVTDAGSEIQPSRQLLEAIELQGILMQADVLHGNRPASSPARRRNADCGNSSAASLLIRIVPRLTA